MRLYGEQGSPPASWATQLDAQIRRVFRLHLETALAALRIGDLQLTVDRHPKPKSASFGVRCLIPVFRWAAASGRAYVSRELLDLRASGPKPTRDRVLAREELAKLLPVLRASSSPYAAGLRMMLLTAARRGEVSAARWRDIAYSAWTLPITKNGKPHVVPLSRQANVLIAALEPAVPDPEAFVFTTNGKPLDNWDRETDRLQAASGTASWTRHDLRRTAATMMGELGVMPDIIEATLNHTAIHSRLAAVYNRSRYRPEVAAALQQLADARSTGSSRAWRGDHSPTDEAGRPPIVAPVCRRRRIRL